MFFNLYVAVVVAEVADVDGSTSRGHIQQPVKVVLVGVGGVEYADEKGSMSRTTPKTRP